MTRVAASPSEADWYSVVIFERDGGTDYVYEYWCGEEPGGDDVAAFHGIALGSVIEITIEPTAHRKESMTQTREGRQSYPDPITDLNGLTADQRHDVWQYAQMAMASELHEAGVPWSVAFQVISDAYWFGWKEGYATAREKRS